MAAETHRCGFPDVPAGYTLANKPTFITLDSVSIILQQYQHIHHVLLGFAELETTDVGRDI